VVSAHHPRGTTVTIAINGYKNPELLRQCLKSVFENMADSEIDYEVLVCDSATEDDTRLLMAQEFPEVRFFPFAENVGFKKLFNTSLLEAKGEYVFAINSDVLLTKEVVPELLGYLAAHSEVGVVGPRQLHFNGNFQQTAFRFYRPETILYRRTFLGKTALGKKHLDWFTMKGESFTKVTPVDWVMGSAMFVRRDQALGTVGLMDERFFMYMEDVDWCRRFWEQGLIVMYHPGATLYHYHAKGSAKGGVLRGIFSNKLMWYHIHSALKYFWKYRGHKNPRTV
jgi:N-acetylglucosaminyl-diphospho-decaprenol L-rhamnosyltransferase